MIKNQTMWASNLKKLVTWTTAHRTTVAYTYDDPNVMFNEQTDYQYDGHDSFNQLNDKNLTVWT